MQDECIWSTVFLFGTFEMPIMTLGVLYTKKKTFKNMLLWRYNYNFERLCIRAILTYRIKLLWLYLCYFLFYFVYLKLYSVENRGHTSKYIQYSEVMCLVYRLTYVVVAHVVQVNLRKKSIARWRLPKSSWNVALKSLFTDKSPTTSSTIKW